MEVAVALPKARPDEAASARPQAERETRSDAPRTTPRQKAEASDNDDFRGQLRQRGGRDDEPAQAPTMAPAVIPAATAEPAPQAIDVTALLVGERQQPGLDGEASEDPLLELATELVALPFATILDDAAEDPDAPILIDPSGDAVIPGLDAGAIAGGTTGTTVPDTVPDAANGEATTDQAPTSETMLAESTIMATAQPTTSRPQAIEAPSEDPTAVALDTGTEAAIDSTIQATAPTTADGFGNGGNPQGNAKRPAGTTITETTAVGGEDRSAFESILPSAGQNSQSEEIAIQRPVPQAPPAPAPQSEAGPADRAIANQITRALIEELPNGDRQLQLRLTPPELGTVRIQIVEHQGQLTVRMNAEDEGVRHALERALPQLRQDLRSNNAPVADLQLADSPFFNLNDQTRDQQQTGQGRRSRGGARFSLTGIDATSDEQAPPRATRSNIVSDQAVDISA